MDFMLLELVLWGGLLFFFWALKDGLGNVESDIESLGLLSKNKRAEQAQQDSGIIRPERVSDPIGSYRDSAIYRYAVIQGRMYQFDRICPLESEMKLEPGERYVAPGLVYQECRETSADAI
ncbi:MAG TPA: hypothetical protein VJ698_16800 [Noviherbaspirillum sp.]|uniref:hypothetical protein n=1 Tax=Noviherbaspirillum sp. TaxID=1926288 RepID=UPI002B4A41DD|nr:hypothetical protein [Noviherbaspirillum sp.]HJV87126.1 hypothetical protein [Noviherbaspirillum sp.]